MRRVSARAAAGPARGGLPNALFVRAAVERLPPELTGVSALQVVMPWGSLLHTVLGGDPQALAGLAAACRPGASFLIALNLHAWRPPVPDVADLPEPDPAWAHETLATAYAAAGLRLGQVRHLTGHEVADLHSSWARRLAASRQRLDVLALTGTVDQSAGAVTARR